MEPILVYIAAPYTLGDMAVNVGKAIRAGEDVAQLGFIPYIPHLNHFWHMIHPHDPGYWYEYDYHWLDVCHCLLRLPGESKGADNEMRRMVMQGKPCFLDTLSLREYYAKT